MSTPSSQIYICEGVPLDSTYTHSLYFERLETQEQYFWNKHVHSFTGYTYLRREWSIKVQYNAEQARAWNYLYFTNDGQRYYYYFINKVEYINDNTVELHLEMDVIQTYICYWQLHPCYVARNHVTDDTIGANTVDEGLDIGDIVDNNVTGVSDLVDCCLLVLSMQNMQNELAGPGVLGSIYDNTYSGLGLYAVNIGRDLLQLNVALENVLTSEKIVAMWMYPKCFVTLGRNAATGAMHEWNDGAVFKTVMGAHFATVYSQGHSRLPTLNNYQPRNNKLLTYPYCALYATNNTGDTAIYRYEYFLNPENCAFKLIGSLDPSGSVTMYPIYYNTNEGNLEESLTLTGFPSCAWSSDTYKLWLAQTQNQRQVAKTGAYVNAGIGLANSIASVAVGAVSQNPSMVAGGITAAGASVAGGWQQIAMQNAETKDRSYSPDQTRGVYSSNNLFANSSLSFSIKQKSIKAESAARIDSYFDLYGYAIKRVMTPNLCARSNWTYIQTVDCNITIPGPNDDAVKLHQIFDKGITFWRASGRVFDYTRSNTPYISGGGGV